MTDPRRARLEALAQWARDLPDLDTEEAEARLVEVMGGEEQAGELLRRVAGGEGGAPPAT